MKKILLFSVALCSQIFFAQANRFIYQVTMRTDSIHPEASKSEMAYLDIDSQKSLFYGEKQLKRDSIMGKMMQTGSFNFDRSQMENLRSNIDFTVEKDLKTGTKTYKSRIARDQYAYEEDRPMEWKILPETAKIGDYKTQKAETNFAGRTWFAWFTSDIPFQDGPYKFSGLPGLIVKAEDSKGDYSFDLKESKKITELPSLVQRGTTIKVKRDAFTKQMEKYKKDPMSFMSQGASGGGRVMIGGGNSSGRAMNPNDPEIRKRIEERVKEEQKKNNNPIELK
ncbi:GLPGLI family protein [Chryseobacterium sp.]|uniref:GLPGLI family protein n=1 Tax=Chryseobacterium sp. TaxID=1871047 RepID=UPI0011C78E9F|nr:GLPGLI family protein [Chryseobacterium sp.]TXF75816.1 GLPGLI family protein [Chryseobacterium sp.]